MSSKNTNSGTGSTTYNYNNNNNQVTIFKGSVVLCQHGFLGNENTLLPLFENLKENAFKEFYGCKFASNVLRYTELSRSNVAIREINTMIENNSDTNIFVRTLFSNPQYGNVTTQACELKEMIDTIRYTHPNIPIVLLGYSKGGVVNCKCAINNEGLIEKIINIGTPHDDTLIQDIIQIITDKLISQFNVFGRIPNVPARLAIQWLSDKVQEGIDTLLHEKVTYKNLTTEWNNMNLRPKFTPIAGEAIAVNGEFNGDFIVPTESAMANAFRGRTYSHIIDNFIVKDDRVTISTGQIASAMGDASAILDILGAASESILGADVVKIVEALFDIIANIVSNEGDFGKCLKLAHTTFFDSKDFILTHDTISMRVLAGLNA